MGDEDGWARARGGVGHPPGFTWKPQPGDVGGSGESGDARGGRRPGPHTRPGMPRYPGGDTTVGVNECQVVGVPVVAW